MDTAISTQISGKAHRAAHHMGIDQIALNLLEHLEQHQKDQRLYRRSPESAGRL